MLSGILESCDINIVTYWITKWYSIFYLTCISNFIKKIVKFI